MSRFVLSIVLGLCCIGGISVSADALIPQGRASYMSGHIVNVGLENSSTKLIAYIDLEPNTLEARGPDGPWLGTQTMYYGRLALDVANPSYKDFLALCLYYQATGDRVFLGVGAQDENGFNAIRFIRKKRSDD